MKSITFSIAFVLLSSLLLSSQASDLYPEKQAIKMVRNTLKDKNVEFLEKLEVKETLGKEDAVLIYRMEHEGNELYSVFTQTKGRYDKFDYLVVVNKDMAIETIRILKYRSEYGGEIASKKWLSQFEDYSSGELRYKKEISALSGATLSASALVADIPLVLKILKASCQ